MGPQDLRLWGPGSCWVSNNHRCWRLLTAAGLEPTGRRFVRLYDTHMGRLLVSSLHMGSRSLVRIPYVPGLLKSPRGQVSRAGQILKSGLLIPPLTCP